MRAWSWSVLSFVMVPVFLMVTVFAAAAPIVGCGGGAGGSPDAGADASPDGSGDGAVDRCASRPAEAPSRRGEVGGVYDATRERIVIFGGDVRDAEMCGFDFTYVDDLWAFNLDCNNWEPITPAGTPPSARGRMATTLDTTRERMLMFGGRWRAGASGVYTLYDETWALDLATDSWSQLVTTGTPPAPRANVVAVYDEGRDRMLVFGGNTSNSGLSYFPQNDLFALDMTTLAWSEIVPPASPEPTYLHGGVVGGDQFFVFGGTPDFDGPYFGTLWALDLTTDTWTALHDGSGTAPDPRFGGELFYDAALGRVILVMGHDPFSIGNRNDAWAFDLTTGTWAMLHPGDTLNSAPIGFCDFPPDFTIPEEGAPERRYSFVHGQSATTAFVFGGKTDCGNINDVWSLSLETADWLMLRPPTGGEACNRSGSLTCTSLCY